MEAKEPKAAILLCKVEDGNLHPVPGVEPFECGSVDRLSAWLKKNAPGDGTFAFAKVLFTAKIRKIQVEKTLFETE